jgi:hypothetical protein
MPDANHLPERETYTAKQIAVRVGTDAKTLRKFFRSPASTVDPVGQGGRYEFDAALLPKIREEFNAWKRRGSTPKGRNAPPKNTPVIEEDPVEEIEDDDEELELEDDEEPDDMSLEELADLVEELQNEDPPEGEVTHDEYNTGGHS